MFEREYRDLAHVPRWGIAPTIKTQSVAEHSYFVTLYAMMIAEQIGYQQDQIYRIVNYALLHDRAEGFMSDIPGPVKRSIVDEDKAAGYEKMGIINRYDDPWRGRPSSTIKAIVKLADLMDEWAFWCRERDFGNQFFHQISPQILTRLEGAASSLYIILEGKRAIWSEIVEPFIDGCDQPKLIPECNTDVAS